VAKVGVVLLNMGGPDSLDAVEPFLYNLFSDHDIIRIPRLIQKPVARLIAKIRSKKTKHYYEIMGGRSPQKEQTLQQAEALSRALGHDFRVVVAMRYWHPFTDEALQELFQEEISKIVLLPLYPQFSRTTTGSSFNEFKRVYEGSNFPKVPVIKIESFHNHPLYIKAITERIHESLPSPEGYHFLFSAHSLPRYVIREGDPYQKQTEETVRLVMENFPNVPHSLAYQSKVGPVKWLEPMTEEVIKDLASRGVENICLIPISFVCEHSETLYEQDYLYGNLARELGIKNFVRVPTLQDHPTFIKALKDLVLGALSNERA
jgi:ferrochelatase